MGSLKCRFLQAALALSATSLLAMSGAAVAFAADAASGAVYKGRMVAVGDGSMRTVVRTDGAGKPVSLAIEISPYALGGLPTKLNKATVEGQWEYSLPLPAQGPQTGYREVGVDWNPHGHPPPHIYTVPHFDFHFYQVPADEVAQVAFSGPKDPKVKVANAKLVAPDYQVIPDTAVNKMGVHAIDTMAPEFHGKPFTATFIYGYYEGRLIFVEPMVTQAFLQSKPDFAAPVKAPAEYSVPGYHPTKYAVRYDAANDVYVVELDGLKYWPGTS